MFQVPESQPDVEWELTNLLGYSQELGEVGKNKKKFVRLAHLDIFLLKLGGDEIKGFPVHWMLGQMAMPQMYAPIMPWWKIFRIFFFYFFLNPLEVLSSPTL